MSMDNAMEGGVPEGAMQNFKSVSAEEDKLLEKPVSLNANGADERARRIAILLANGKEDVALNALSAVASAKLATLPESGTLEDGTEVGDMLEAFVAEKRRVLMESASVLKRQANGELPMPGSGPDGGGGHAAAAAAGVGGGDEFSLPKLEMPKLELPKLPF